MYFLEYGLKNDVLGILSIRCKIRCDWPSETQGDRRSMQLTCWSPLV